MGFFSQATNIGGSQVLCITLKALTRGNSIRKANYEEFIVTSMHK